MMFSLENSPSRGSFFLWSSDPHYGVGGENTPPHQRARRRYEEIVDAGNFICTHEYPSKANPRPLVFTVDEQGLHLDDARSRKESASALSAAVTAARGSQQPPGVQVGFG